MNAVVLELCLNILKHLALKSDLNLLEHLVLNLSRTEVVTPEVPDHVTMGRSCDQTRSKSSCDPSRDQAPKKVLTLSDKESGDKEREHTLMHAYFCRRDLCYVHDRY